MNLRMDKLLSKREIIIVSGIALIVFGFVEIYYLFLSALAFSSGGAAQERWHFVISLSIPLFIISGSALFSFKEWTRKPAIVSYAIALSHLILDYIVDYRTAIFFKYKFHFFGGTRFFEHPVLINILIFLFFLVILFLSKDQFQEEKNAGKSFQKTIAYTVIIFVLVLFASLYFSVIALFCKQSQDRIEAQRYIELITPQIKNDPRFQKVNFDITYDGYPFAKGMVRNQQDWQALQDIMSPIRLGFWVEVDRPYSIETDSENFVNIGVVEMSHATHIVSLLNNNGIKTFIKNAKYPGDNSVRYIYVLFDKKEQAVNLLKQDPNFKEEY